MASSSKKMTMAEAAEAAEAAEKNKDEVRRAVQEANAKIVGQGHELARNAAAAAAATDDVPDEPQTEEEKAMESRRLRNARARITRAVNRIPERRAFLADTTIDDAFKVNVPREINGFLMSIKKAVEEFPRLSTYKNLTPKLLEEAMAAVEMQGKPKKLRRKPKPEETGPEATKLKTRRAVFGFKAREASNQISAALKNIIRYVRLGSLEFLVPSSPVNSYKIQRDIQERLVELRLLDDIFTTYPRQAMDVSRISETIQLNRAFLTKSKRLTDGDDDDPGDRETDELAEQEESDIPAVINSGRRWFDMKTVLEDANETPRFENHGKNKIVFPGYGPHKYSDSFFDDEETLERTRVKLLNPYTKEYTVWRSIVPDEATIDDLIADCLDAEKYRGTLSKRNARKAFSEKLKAFKELESWEEMANQADDRFKRAAFFDDMAREVFGHMEKIQEYTRLLMAVDVIDASAATLKTMKNIEYTLRFLLSPLYMKYAFVVGMERYEMYEDRNNYIISKIEDNKPLTKQDRSAWMAGRLKRRFDAIKTYILRTAERTNKVVQWGVFNLDRVSMVDSVLTYKTPYKAELKKIGKAEYYRVFRAFRFASDQNTLEEAAESDLAKRGVSVLEGDKGGAGREKTVALAGNTLFYKDEDGEDIDFEAYKNNGIPELMTEVSSSYTELLTSFEAFYGYLVGGLSDISMLSWPEAEVRPFVNRIMGLSRVFRALGGKGSFNRDVQEYNRMLRATDDIGRNLLSEEEEEKIEALKAAAEKKENLMDTLDKGLQKKFKATFEEHDQFVLEVQTFFSTLYEVRAFAHEYFTDDLIPARAALVRGVYKLQDLFLAMATSDTTRYINVLFEEQQNVDMGPFEALYEKLKKEVENDADLEQLVEATPAIRRQRVKEKVSKRLQRAKAAEAAEGDTDSDDDSDSSDADTSDDESL